jgi:polyferredoxin
MLKHLKTNLTNVIILLIFLSTTLTVFFITNRTFYLFDLPFVGISLFIGQTLHKYLPKQKKQIGRRVSQFLVGFYFMFFLAIIIKVNMQIEGLFFQIFSAFFGGAFIHYSIAKLFGPLYFGRGFCGWACWNAMIFDLLPWKKSCGRLPHLGLFRYLHLIIVIFMVSLLIFQFDYSVKTGTQASLKWFVVGNLLYFTVGCGLALILKDNRSFCKYVCPIPPIQKILSRFSILKFRVDSIKCTNCHLCEKSCPMDIKILDYKNAGNRIKSTECILCNACNDICPVNAITLSSGFDVCTEEHFNTRK